MKLEPVLRYLYGCKGIPIWILDSEGGLYLSLAPPEERRDGGELCAFFRRFAEGAKEKPSLYQLGETELFALFTFAEEGETRVAVIGPAFRLQPADTGYRKHLSYDYIYTAKGAERHLMLAPVTEPGDFSAYVQAVLLLLQGRAPETALVLDTLPLGEWIDEELTRRVYNLREEAVLSIYNYDSEQEMVASVRSGAVERVREIAAALRPHMRGNIVPDPYRQTLYETVSFTSGLTRAAIEGGVEPNRAYTMSDLYIRRLDAARSVDELMAAVRRMMVDFTLQVRQSRIERTPTQNEPVRKALNYILQNIHYPLSLTQAAQAAGLSSKYFSALFTAEMGCCFAVYVQSLRIEEAKNLLVYTRMSISEMAQTLTFSSQSYFTKLFRQHTGETPQSYRKQRRRDC